MSRAIKTPQAERDLIADYARIALDKIDPADMSRAAAAIAVIAYVIAEMPERLN